MTVIRRLVLLMAMATGMAGAQALAQIMVLEVIPLKYRAAERSTVLGSGSVRAAGHSRVLIKVEELGNSPR